MIQSDRLKSTQQHHKEVPLPQLNGHAALRILHILPHFYWFGDTSVVGGSTNALFNLAKVQAKTHSVSILSYIPGTTSATKTGAGIRLLPLQGSGDPGTVRFGLHSVLRTAQWLRAHQNDYDLVHLHSGFLDYTLTALLRANAPQPMVYTLYCPIPLDWGRWNKPAYKPLMQRCVRQFPRVTMISHNVQRTLQAYMGGQVPTRVILPGVDVARFHPGPAPSELRARLGLEEDAFVVLFVGNQKPAKNLLTVLRAFAQLRQQFAQARLVITTELRSRIGDSYASTLSDEIDRLGIGEDIRQLGIVDDMPDLMRLCDVLVAPFLDTFGPSDYFMAALEALACGRPVIVSRVGGMPEVVTPDIGYLIDPHRPEELAAAMAELASDHTRCQDMGARGALMVHERFHPSHVAQAYDDLYQELL